MKSCSCGKILDRRNKVGLCKPCFLRRMNTDPGFHARRIEKLRKTLALPQNRADVIRQRTEASRSRMAWCPPEYRNDYRVLTRKAGFLAHEARAAISAQIIADRARYARTGKLQQAMR